MIPIPVVFESKDFVIINKPVDVPMHDPHFGICQRLSTQFGGIKMYLIHRLDTGTSGCLMLAKNVQAASALSKLFEQRQITKLYVALCDQKPNKKQGKIAGDMQKSRKGNYKLTKTHNNPAVTFFKSEALNKELLAVPLEADSLKEHQLQHNHRLFYLKPITGKTHQLRVALKSLGSAIVGDERYKGSKADRLYLHSYALDFWYNSEHFNVSCLPETGALFASLHLTKLAAPEALEWPKYMHPKKQTATLGNFKTPGLDSSK